MDKLKAAAGSIVFLAVAPGVMAGAVPLALTGWHSSRPPWWAVAIGSLMIAAGAGVLLQAFARFVTEGRGTPAPVAPTQRLVVGGLYRYVRNPMYLAVVATITGQALVLGRPVLFIYAAVFWLIVAAFVIGYEEPKLSGEYGGQYTAYRMAVRRWLPHLRPAADHQQPDPGQAQSPQRPGR